MIDADLYNKSGYQLMPVHLTLPASQEEEAESKALALCAGFSAAFSPDTALQELSRNWKQRAFPLRQERPHGHNPACITCFRTRNISAMLCCKKPISWTASANR